MLKSFAYRLQLILVLTGVGALAASQLPLLFRNSTLSQTQIVFSYAGDLWSVPRDGGEARRLTTGAGTETNPIFSPDGEEIAFQGEYDGNVDVYAMPAAGGNPRRLTYHPAADVPVAWTPDGKSVMFYSSRESFSGFARLFTIARNGGFPAAIDLPMGNDAAFSPD